MPLYLFYTMVQKSQKWPKTQIKGGGGSCLKGSMERSLLLSAIFLIFTQNRPWRPVDHPCTLFFIEMLTERHEKSERTLPILWCPWALAYSRDQLYNFSCLWVMLKNSRLGSYFLGLGSHLASKRL